jgi:hypothetical protein
MTYRINLKISRWKRKENKTTVVDISGGVRRI